MSITLLINAELGKEDGLIKELRNIEKVKETRFVYGIYDIIAKVEVESVEKLRKILTSKIRHLIDVRST